MIYKSDYQNILNINNMLENKILELRIENNDLKTINQKLDFEIKYLQGQNQSPDIEWYKSEIEQINNRNEEQ